MRIAEYFVIRQYWGLAACLLLLISLAGIAQGEPSTAVERSQIAYLRLTDNYWQVWVTDSQGASHRQLTFDAMDKTRVSWSASRGELLCNRNNGDLILVSLEGQFKPLKLPMNGMLDAAWSPDGHHIAFSLNATQTTDNNDLWVINTDGTGARQITNQSGVVQSPSWHPDKQELAYSLGVARNYVDIWRIEIDTGSKEQLTIAGNRYFSPTYAPNGNVLYVSGIKGNFDIFELDSQGKSAAITSDPAYDGEPSAAPDGTRIAFYSLRGGAKRIWITDRDSGDVHAITPVDAQSRNPVWLN